MREKTPKTVVTFATTSDALAVESKAKATGFPGRVIPVPSAVSAGCGLAWCVPEYQRAALEHALQIYDLSYEGLYTVDLY